MRFPAPARVCASAAGANISGVAAAPIRADNSLGRLLTLADGIFAIAMTLLSLDLMVPTDMKDSKVPGYLAHHLDSYLSYFLTFYVVADDTLRNRDAVPPTVALAVVVIAVAVRTAVLIIRAEHRRHAGTSWFRSRWGSWRACS